MRVGLVLGSGGARGLAHIGVINELQARGHEVVRVAGSSAGALVGGFLAAGRFEDFQGFMLGVSKADVVRHIDPMLRASGLVRGRRLMETLRAVLGEPRIEDCVIPCTIVASDVVNWRPVELTSGSLLMAMRASFAIPVLFPPVMVGGRLLADGGLLWPLPVGVLAGADVDLTVGVSLFGRLEAPVIDRVDPGATAMPGREEMVASDWRQVPAGFDLVRSGLVAIEMMQAEIQRNHLMSAAPDVLVDVPADACAFFEFDQAARMIALGRDLAAAALDAAGV